MSDLNYNIEFNSDTQGIDAADRAINDLNSESRNLAEAFNDISNKQGLIDQFKSLKVATDSAKKSWREAQQPIAGLAQRYNELKPIVDGLKQSIDEQKETLAAQRAELKEARKSASEFYQTLKDTKKAYGRKSEAVKEATHAYENAKLKVDILNRSVSEQRDELAQTRKEYRELNPELKQTTREFESAKKEADRTKNNYNALNEQLHKTRSAMREAGISTKDLAQEQIRLNEAAEEAERALATLTEETERLQRIASAKAVLGLDVDDRARQEIEAINRAFKELKESGTLTQSELARATQLHSDRLEALQHRLGETSQSVEDLFGIRPSNVIESEINEVNAALNRLQRELEQGRISQRDFERSMQAGEARLNSLQAELNQTASATNHLNNNLDSSNIERFASGIGGAKNALLGFAGAYVGVETVTSGIRELVDTSRQLDSLNQKLEYATGSAQAAGETWDYLKDLANELGLEQMGLANGYAQLASATKNLNLSQEDTKLAFEGVANASAAMSLTTDEANGVFLALSQIAGKGKVSMEELRGQLGERLTPAMGIAAEAMGVTTSKLEKMVEQGIDAKEFLPKFGVALTEAFSEQAQNNINTTTGALNELSNKTTDLQEKLLNGFAGEALTKGISLLSDGIDAISNAIDNIDPATIDATKQVFIQTGEAVKQLASFIIDTYNNVNDLINAFTGVSDAEEQVGILTRSLQGLGIVLGGVNDVFKGLKMAAQLTVGTITASFATIYEQMGKIGALPDSVQENYQKLGANLRQISDNTFDSLEKGASEFESSFVAALDSAAKTQQDRLNETAQVATATFESIASDGNATAADIESAFTEMATAQIAAYGAAEAEALNAQAAQYKLKVSVDETGKALVEQMTASEQAANDASVRAEELNQKYNKLAKTVGLGLSESFEKARDQVTELYADFDDLTDAGYDVGEVTTAALVKMANEAKNTAEIENLTALINEMGLEGKLAGEDIEYALQTTKNRANELADRINGVTKAFEFLGIKSREELAKNAAQSEQSFNIVKKSGQATTEQLQKGFETYARAAVAANDGVISSQLEAEARQQGLNLTISETGRVAVESMGRASRSTQATITPVNKAKDAVRDLGAEAKKSGDRMSHAANKAYDSYDRLGDRIERINNASLNITPDQSNQFGSRKGVEKYLKEAGLSADSAASEAQRLYDKAGQKDGALNTAVLQGYEDGRLLSANDLNNLKSTSEYLSDIAESARRKAERDKQWEAKKKANREAQRERQESNSSHNSSITQADLDRKDEAMRQAHINQIKKEYEDDVAQFNKEAERLELAALEKYDKQMKSENVDKTDYQIAWGFIAELNRIAREYKRTPAHKRDDFNFKKPREYAGYDGTMDSQKPPPKPQRQQVQPTVSLPPQTSSVSVDDVLSAFGERTKQAIESYFKEKGAQEVLQQLQQAAKNTPI